MAVLYFGILTILLISVGFLLYDILREYDSQKCLNKDFALLSSGFKNKTILGRWDIYSIYKPHLSVYKNNYPFPVFLNQYLNHIRANPDGITSEEFLDIRAMIESLIEEEESNIPFNGVPDAERGLLLSLKNTCDTEECKKLTQLADMIRCSSADLEKKKKENKISTGVSIIGIILTVFFGILSYRLQKESNNLRPANNEVTSSPNEVDSSSISIDEAQ